MELPRSTLAEQGIDPRGIHAFLDAVAKRGLELHSLMLLRHGEVIAEGRWAPYGPDRPHQIYSSGVVTGQGQAPRLRTFRALKLPVQEVFRSCRGRESTLSYLMALFSDGEAHQLWAALRDMADEKALAPAGLAVAAR